ncbi:MAG: DUF2007 domain-containing protein [Bacteroidota bacterium]
MKYCVNHQDIKALSVCHNCGRDFCRNCLSEGSEYYYCNSEECQLAFKNETRQINLPESFVCPNCDAEIELSDDERSSGLLHCPECEALIDLRTDPPQIIDNENFSELLSSLNQGDIGIIKSMLDDAGIDYYVFGENFLSADPLIQPARFFVNEKQMEEAREILKELKLHIFGASNREY